MSGRFTTSYRQDLRLFPTVPRRVTATVVAAMAIGLPFLLSLDVSPPWGLPWTEWFSAINIALIASIGAVAFNLLVGYTGQLSAAHAGFFILGAIAAGIFGQQLGLSFFLVLPIATALGAVVGAIVALPALRVRGLYLFMATLAIHFAAVFAFQRYQTTYFGYTGVIYDYPEVPGWLHWLPFIAEDDSGRFEIKGNERWYWLLLPVAVLTILFAKNVVRTREGRGFIAVRDNDVAAGLMGVNPLRTKLLAFALSSALVTLAGTLLAYYLGARSTESWSLEIVLDYSVMVVVGGFSSIAGGVLGALFFYLAPVLFAWIRSWNGINDIGFVSNHGPALDRLVFGLAVVVVLVFKPGGLHEVWQDVRRFFGRWPYRYDR